MCLDDIDFGSKSDVLLNFFNWVSSISLCEWLLQLRCLPLRTLCGTIFLTSYSDWYSSTISQRTERMDIKCGPGEHGNGGGTGDPLNNHQLSTSQSMDSVIGVNGEEEVRKINFLSFSHDWNPPNVHVIVFYFLDLILVWRNQSFFCVFMSFSHLLKIRMRRKGDGVYRTDVEERKRIGQMVLKDFSLIVQELRSPIRSRKADGFWRQKERDEDRQFLRTTSTRTIVALSLIGNPGEERAGHTKYWKIVKREGERESNRQDDDRRMEGESLPWVLFLLFLMNGIVVRSTRLWREGREKREKEEEVRFSLSFLVYSHTGWGLKRGRQPEKRGQRSFTEREKRVTRAVSREKGSTVQSQAEQMSVPPASVPLHEIRPISISVLLLFIFSLQHANLWSPSKWPVNLPSALYFRYERRKGQIFW